MCRLQNRNSINAVLHGLFRCIRQQIAEQLHLRTSINEILPIIRMAFQMPNARSRYIESFLKPPMSDTKQPGNGFYQFINQKWLKQTKLPSWLSEYGASEEIEAHNRKEIEEILEKCQDKPPNIGEIPNDARGHIGFFQHIWKNRDYAKEHAFIRVLINQILDCRDVSDFSFLLGSLCKSGVLVLLNLKIREEHRKPYFSRKTLIPADLTLPDSYFFDKDSPHKKIWKAYEEYVTTCAIELGLPYLTLAIDAEKELAEILTKNDSSEDSRELRGRDLINILPEFGWEEFMNGMGMSSNWRQEFWILDDPLCTKRLLRWFCTAEKEKVAALFTLRLLNIYSEYLHPNIETATFNLFQKEMRGINVKMPDEIRFIMDISSALPFALCSEFAKMEYNIQKQKEVERLVERIKVAAVNTMRVNKSLTKRTTARVIEKIRRMKINIGKTKSGYLPKIPYYPESIIHTTMSIISTQNADSYRKSGHPSERSTLTYPCFIVNASYYEETNQIVIPWGILHPPFFVSEAPLGWNYGGIGATIAHEISHAFDIDGSKYNPQGQYRPWWTRKNTENFKRRTRKMADFFTKHKRFGVHLNGKKTLSENWADFGGIVIVLKALKDELKAKGVTDEQEIKEAMKLLFIGYAVSWRDKMRKKKVLYNILKSVHSLPEDRVDLIVPHFQEWVDAFDIKESDPLFIPVGQRLKFF